jgi:hypothetical protein
MTTIAVNGLNGLLEVLMLLDDQGTTNYKSYMDIETNMFYINVFYD